MIYDKKENKFCRIISIPEFSETGSVVLMNLTNLDTFVMNFNSKWKIMIRKEKKNNKLKINNIYKLYKFISILIYLFFNNNINIYINIDTGIYIFRAYFIF